MIGPEHGIRLRGSARSDTGQVRENNEDNVHLWTQDDLVLAIVADGMGGAVAGEEASRIAVETIQKSLPPGDKMLNGLDQDAVSDKLVDIIRSANMNIVQRALSFPELRGMGTTITLALVRNTQVTIAHVGDSRAYQIDGHDGSITQITSDHSFVEALLAAGHITREQAEDHPMRNVLYRALGQSEEIDVDLYFQRLHIGDRLVLCSDGLTRHLKPEEIAQLALGDENPEVISQKLVDLANKRGGEDNVSVIVVKVEETEESKQKSAQSSTYDDDEDTVFLDKKRPFTPESRASLDDTLVGERRDVPRFKISYASGEGHDPFTPSQ
ncbi:MAG: Stp1/IreP family PP2C-type Ser/Thr phosphatase [Anaerolineae bacterium]